MKELIEWMEQELKGHELIGSDYGLGLRSGISRCIAKAKELEAANCDHKNCLNYSKDLRQNHSEDTLDMRDPLAEAWDSEEDKIWDTLDMHTFKVGDRVRVVSNQASMANENCGRHEFEIGAVVELRYWSDGSKSWEAKNKSDCWNIDPADIEPCQKEFRWEEKLNNLLATKSKAELLEAWDRVNKEIKKGPALSDYFEKLEE